MIKNIRFAAVPAGLAAIAAPFHALATTSGCFTFNNPNDGALEHEGRQSAHEPLAAHQHLGQKGAGSSMEPAP
jgi:hypothetical protein